MLVTKRLNECYAICSIVERGIWKDERIVVLGLEKEWLRLNTNCLRLTGAGLVAARFAIEKVSGGIVYGCVYNCQDGRISGMRNIPKDSITKAEYTMPYDGRLVLANSPIR